MLRLLRYRGLYKVNNIISFFLLLTNSFSMNCALKMFCLNLLTILTHRNHSLIQKLLMVNSHDKCKFFLNSLVAFFQNTVLLFFLLK